MSKSIETARETLIEKKIKQDYLCENYPQFVVEKFNNSVKVEQGGTYIKIVSNGGIGDSSGKKMIKSSKRVIFCWPLVIMLLLVTGHWIMCLMKNITCVGVVHFSYNRSTDRELF